MTFINFCNIFITFL